MPLYCAVRYCMCATGTIRRGRLGIASNQHSHLHMWIPLTRIGGLQSTPSCGTECCIHACTWHMLQGVGMQYCATVPPHDKDIPAPQCMYMLNIGSCMLWNTWVHNDHALCCGMCANPLLGALTCTCRYQMPMPQGHRVWGAPSPGCSAYAYQIP